MKSIRSSVVTPWRSNGGGLVGNGCVAAVRSPGVSDVGTGRSSIGHTGRPVARSKTNAKACFVSCTTALILRPPTVMSARIGAAGKIVVPQVVMDDLVVPDAFARRAVHGDESVAEQIVAQTMSAIHVIGRTRQRKIREPQFLVGADQRPEIRLAGSRSRTRFPRCRCRTRPPAG